MQPARAPAPRLPTPQADASPLRGGSSCICVLFFKGFYIYSVGTSHTPHRLVYRGFTDCCCSFGAVGSPCRPAVPCRVDLSSRARGVAGRVVCSNARKVAPGAIGPAAWLSPPPPPPPPGRWDAGMPGPGGGRAQDALRTRFAHRRLLHLTGFNNSVMMSAVSRLYCAPPSPPPPASASVLFRGVGPGVALAAVSFERMR